MNLTICSVSYNSAVELLSNIGLCNRLNPTCPPQWVIADNSPANSPERLTQTLENVTVVPGAGAGHTAHFHHTIALADAIERAETRFILILDPDFFIIYENWVAQMIAHMLESRLAILGVPWHPLRIDKYRYFPAVHCALFDTNLLPKQEIDFRPDYSNGEDDPEWPEGYSNEENFFAINPVTPWLAKLPPFRHRRTYYTDTGGRLFKKFVKDHHIAFELIEPVYDPAAHASGLTAKTRLLEKLLPDELCYVPKHYRSTAGKSFLQMWLNEPRPLEWEEFIWRDAAFGFHMRRNVKADQRSHEHERRIAKEVLAMLDDLSSENESKS